MFEGVTSWGWLAFFAAGLVLWGIFAQATGWTFLKPRKLSRYKITPSRVNVAGITVESHHGRLKVDSKRGYDAKHELLYLEGLREPLPNVRFPDLAKCMEGDTEATIWPAESFATSLMNDVRGRTLRYLPPSLTRVSVKQGDGVVFLSRDVAGAQNASMAKELQSISMQEQIETATESSFQRQQKLNALAEDYGKAQSTLFAGLLQATSQNKQRG